MTPIVVTHSLSEQQAHTAAERIAGALQEQYGGSWSWVAEHALQFQHHLIAGTLAVFSDRLELAINFGPALTAFAGRITQHLQVELAARLQEASRE